MTDNVIHFNPGAGGDGVALDPSAILDANKAEFVRVALVGVRADGSYAVAGSHGSAESLLLLSWGANFIITNEVAR